MVQLIKNKNGFKVKSGQYVLIYNRGDRFYIGLKFRNGIGAKLYIPSSCDKEGEPDKCINISCPFVRRTKEGKVIIKFRGKSSIWRKKEYIFECREDAVIYLYTVEGKGDLSSVRYFEGFLKDDPKLSEYGFPYFAGATRDDAYHRPLKAFMNSSVPGFELIYSPTINSSDTRYFMCCEQTRLRVNGSRSYLGGDWLVTPPPFCYFMGTKKKREWVSLGLTVKPGEYNFLEYQYLGGEGFGLNLTYEGCTKIQGKWESPGIVFQSSRGDYNGLKKYVSFLQKEGYIRKIKREIADWWRNPIFSCWGEQMWLSDKWKRYVTGGAHIDMSEFCSQKFYNRLLKTLEKYGINPGILVIDNRWCRNDDKFIPDPKSWPDMKGFIERQHRKGRRVILWVSPWHHGFVYGKFTSVVAWELKLSKKMPADECIWAPADTKIKIDEMGSDINTDILYPYTCFGRKVKPPEKKPVVYQPVCVDPTNPKYEKRLREKVRYAISPEGLNADGFEFDYTHFVPTVRGVKSYSDIRGGELLKKLLSIYYDESKKTKKDALIITHTFNPYFADVVDMCRLQDLYSDKKSVVKQMTHRARIAEIVCPGCVIDTDNHPIMNLEAWCEYAKVQPSIGVPALYYVSGIETTGEKLKPKHFRMLKRIWDDYTENLR